MGLIYRCCTLFVPTSILLGVSHSLYPLQSTLKFVNEDAASVHGSVRASSIFTSESGEWKLGGLDILSSMKEDDAIIYVRYYPRKQDLRLTMADNIIAGAWQPCGRFRTFCPTRDSKRRMGHH